MRLSYTPLALLGLVAILWPGEAAAQATACPATPECVVQWQDPATGEPIINALPSTIAGDTGRPANRVYKLLRGGFYYQQQRISNGGFNLAIVGQTAAEGGAAGLNFCGDSGTADCGPAIIQRFRNEDGSVDAFMLESSGNGNGGVRMANVWLMGMDNTGVTANYEPITINSTNSRLVFDSVVFDRNDWHHLGIKGAGNRIFIRNSSFRNLVGPTQIYEGRGFRLESGADTMIVENNSFLNIGFAPIQSEAAPINYFVFNHNTLVNFGRNLNAGAIWKNAYLANNLFVNPFYQGESPIQYNDPARTEPLTGVFSISALPARFGLERDRRILLSNNGYFRNAEIEAAYAPLAIRSQPLVNDSTQKFFNLYPGMVNQGNINASPGFATAPTDAATINKIKTFLDQYVNTRVPLTLITWDPGRDPSPLANIWPLPENLTYTNAQFRTAGTDGLPLGDLNWYPQAKQTYLADASRYQKLEALAGPPPPVPTAPIQFQAEAGTVQGGTVQTVEGQKTLFFTSGGSAQWTFTVPTDGTYGLDIQTDLRGSDPRGEYVELDGVNLRNYANGGELFFCTAAVMGCPKPLATANGLTTFQLRNSDLLPGADGPENALVLKAGAHTLRIRPSYGYQAFGNITVVNASGATVQTLTPAEATTVGVAEECPTGTYCPSGFQSVALDAGGSITWTGTVPANTVSALAVLYYQSTTGGTGRLLVDGQEVVPNVSLRPTTGTASVNVNTTDFPITAGSHTFTFVAATAGINLDYLFINGFAQNGTSTQEPLTDGFALGVSYPNPSRGSSTIRYEVGTASEVSLVVYDVLGRKVATLVDGVRPAGPDEVRFDAGQLSSGTYILRYTTPVGVQVRQMTVVR